ncbi:uncharacterized protein BP5553_10087 [Venustampulla echinocandica]|uniref:Tubby C-terminal domain-containing protein n=1 Tax=Venustampulla echinocandica TaxID=2656787 RepID=A0A370TAB9_9HELO|nr:uncharacterized protein BP5553_10087 [Venustampulla echinocandica]RDL30742.1 hypothetical protein BP5553_10087 [Venustampulla echinocandica]
MDTILETQSSPIAITKGFITKAETYIAMHCHDKIFKRVTVLDETGKKLFTVESKPFASWSWRRTIKDISGIHIFDLREGMDNAIRHKWIAESPSGREICSVRHASLLKRLILDVAVKDEEGKGNESMVRIIPTDQGGITMLVNIEGTTAAEIRMTESNVHSTDRDRSVWRARVASGVDLVFIVAIMLCRAEILHAWKK